MKIKITFSESSKIKIKYQQMILIEPPGGEDKFLIFFHKSQAELIENN